MSMISKAVRSTLCSLVLAAVAVLAGSPRADASGSITSEYPGVAIDSAELREGPMEPCYNLLSRYAGYKLSFHNELWRVMSKSLHNIHMNSVDEVANIYDWYFDAHYSTYAMDKKGVIVNFRQRAQWDPMAGTCTAIGEIEHIGGILSY